MIIMVAIVCVFANRFYFLGFSLVSTFLRLKAPKDKAFLFCSNFLLIYQGFFKSLCFLRLFLKLLDLKNDD